MAIPIYTVLPYCVIIYVFPYILLAVSSNGLVGRLICFAFPWYSLLFLVAYRFKHWLVFCCCTVPLKRVAVSDRNVWCIIL